MVKKQSRGVIIPNSSFLTPNCSPAFTAGNNFFKKGVDFVRKGRYNV